MLPAKINADDTLSSLLSECREQLWISRRSFDRAAELLDEAMASMADAGVRSQSPGAVRQVLESFREELLAAAVAATRGGSSAPVEQPSLELSVVPAERAVLIGRRRLHLTETEYDVLELLWNARPHVVSRDMILRRVYQGKDKPSARTIDVFISHVRQKLKMASGGMEFIEAVRGQGWSLRGSRDADEAGSENDPPSDWSWPEVGARSVR